MTSRVMAVVAFCATTALMLAGCAVDPKPAPPVKLAAPVVVEVAPVRCPDVPGSDARLFSTGPKLPASGPLTDRDVRAAIDVRDAAIAARNAAGRRLITAYDACRGRRK